MRGQWLGDCAVKSEGGDGYNGKIMVNIDEVGGQFVGVAYVSPPDLQKHLQVVAHFATKNKEPVQTTDAFIHPIDPRTGFQCTWEDIRRLSKESGVEAPVHSSTAKVSLCAMDNVLTIEAKTDVGTTLTAVLPSSSGKGKSKIQGQKMSWDEFKSHVSARSKSSYLFRGQEKPWALCTSFHRRGRYRMSEFTTKDVKQLHQRLSAITSHFFDLSVPEQNGAFFNLLQHHGYPTPLLDWSHSPYVAAFFAFRGLPIGYNGDEVVRIYIFNNQEWQTKYRQIPNLDPPFPHISVSEFIAIGNPRLVPQQAVTTATNVDDIETYILARESETGLKFLEAIDIPAKEREVAMRDLRFMGITAGSMFPSIDGVCEEMRERNFDNR